MTDQPFQPLRLLGFGAGAIGAYIGGSLALQGHSLVYLEKPTVAAELRRRGLHLERVEKGTRVTYSLSPSDFDCAETIDEALALGPFDLALFALKSYDTHFALQTISPHSQAFPPVLCLQNGVENEPALAAVLGPDKVIAGTVTSAIGRRAAGDVVLERLRGVGVAKGHPLSARLVAALDEAGIKARLYPRAIDMKWSKLLTNLLANTTSAILDMAPAEIFDHPGLFALELAQLREALAVMAALGARPVDLPGTPVRALAFAVRHLPPPVSRPLLKKAVGGGRGGKMPSFHIDLHSGRGQTEVDYLNGAVVRFGGKLGVPTPANRLLTETLLALSAGQLSPDRFYRQPLQLLDLMKVKPPVEHPQSS